MVRLVLKVNGVRQQEYCSKGSELFVIRSYVGLRLKSPTLVQINMEAHEGSVLEDRYRVI